MILNNRSFILCVLLLCGAGISKVNSQTDTIFKNTPLSQGLWYSETKPIMSPAVFAPDLLNSKIHHLHSAPVFTPDGKYMFFSAYINNEKPQRIFIVEKEGNFWQKPKVASFSGKYQEGNPVVSPDGTKIYFSSKRPDKEEDPELDGSRIWFVEKHDGWREPKLLKFPTKIGIGAVPSYISNSGILYFSVRVAKRDYDIYECKLIENIPTDIKRLDEPISFLNEIELGAITDPDNKLLIFSVFSKTGNNKIGLYISKKTKEGLWSKPRLADRFEILKESRFPGFTPDGEYFFFLSYEEGYEQIYWVKTDLLFGE